MAGIKGSAAPGRAVTLAVMGGALLTFSDAGLKWLSGELAPGQIMFLRGVIGGLMVIAITAATRGAGALHPKSLTIHGLRGAISILATFTYLLGIPDVPLAMATAILFASPILMTALAPFFIGEDVGWRRWSAVGAGFVGVLIIIRPTGSGLEWAVLFILAAAFGEAVRDLITRGASGRETTHSILFTMMLFMAGSGLVLPPYDWPDMAALHWTVMIGATAIWTTAHVFLIEAFRFGEAALLAPFKYCNLFFATILGFVIWGNLPDAWIWTGSAVIVASGLYILHREVLRRAPVTALDPVRDDPELEKEPEPAPKSDQETEPK
ncbi:MAG: DMT family transporter [Rhodospirillaceae bacterium]